MVESAVTTHPPHADAAEAWSPWSAPNWVDPRERFDWGGGEQYGYSYATDSREDGKNAPVIETHDDLLQMQSVARFLADSNPYAKAFLNNLTNFCIGTGFQYTAASKKKRQSPSGLLDAVQDWLDEFTDANDWIGDLERESFLRCHRDGEEFIRLHRGQHGVPKLRVVEPEYVRAPLNERGAEESIAARYPWHEGAVFQPYSWSFGVQTPEDDVCNPLGYYVDWGMGDSEYVPAFEIEHVKAPDNSDRNVKRGISDFYAVAKWLSRSLDLLGGTISGATIQSKIAVITEYEAGASGEGVARVQQSLSDGTIRRPTASGGTKETQVRRFEEGSILHAPTGRKYTPGPMGQPSGPLYLDVLQGGLRAVAARRSMPEHMISADASNNNYASILEAGSPFRKAVEALQAYYKRRWGRLFWRALLIAFNAGRFEAFGLSWAAFQRLVEIQIEAPIPEVQNRTEETARRQVLSTAGILSPKTWAGQEGLDYELEIENGAQPASHVSPVPGASETEAASGGEYADISRLQWKRNTKAIRDVLDGLTSGEMKEPLARTLLASLGMPAASVDALIASAADGTVEDEEIEAAESLTVRREVVAEAVRQMWEAYP